MAENAYVPVRDSILNLQFPNDNYGATDQVRLGTVYGGGVKTVLERGMADFDVSDLAGETVLHAELVRYVFDVVGAGGFAARIARCTRPGTWVESEVTWNNYKAGTPWTAPGGDFTNTDPPFVSYTEAVFAQIGLYTVTGLGGLVQDAIDNRSGILSVIMRAEAEAPVEDGYVLWTSSEHLVEPWRVVVTFGEEAAGPTGRREPYVPGRGERGAARPRRPAVPPGGMRPAAPLRPGSGQALRGATI